MENRELFVKFTHIVLDQRIGAQVKQKVVVMTVVSKSGRVVQRCSSIVIDCMSGFWKPACQIPEEHMKD